MCTTIGNGNCWNVYSVKEIENFYFVVHSACDPCCEIEIERKSCNLWNGSVTKIKTTVPKPAKNVRGSSHLW